MMRFTNEADDKDINVLTFGKHKGETIQEVPDDYILFMCHNFEKDSFWSKAAEQELKCRELNSSTVAISFGKHEGTLISDLPDEYLAWCVMNLDDNPIYFLIMDEVEGISSTTTTRNITHRPTPFVFELFFRPDIPCS